MFKFSLTVDKIAAEFGGELRGNGDLSVRDLKSLDTATSTDLSFFAPTTKRGKGEILEMARTSAAGCIITTEPIEGCKAVQILNPQPLLCVIRLIEKYYDLPSLPAGIDKNAVVADSAEISDTAAVGAFCYIGEGVKIGPRTRIFPNVVVYPGASIGSHCLVHSGAVIREGVTLEDGCIVQNGAIIGGDGFGYFPHPTEGPIKIPHIGGVVLQRAVEVGANTTIDRGMLGSTVVGSMSKLDNLVMVGHNVQIGAASILCGQVGISGSSKIGSRSVLGGQVGVADHVKIASGVRVGAKSGISGNIDEAGDYAGYPHESAKSWRRTVTIIRRLPELLAELRSLRKEVAELKSRLEK
jgi:UDP-3-O-[3-hydroxymyristoyl] glucosamine N-acyltransferase